MLTNATITTWQARTGSDSSGVSVFGAVLDLEARCAMDVPTMTQKRTLDAVIRSATSVCYLLKRAWAHGRPGREDRMSVAIDGSEGRIYEVVHVIDRQKSGGLAHWEVFLQER